MGRGRAKAKQQKVARELKYNSHLTDLDALQRELSSHSSDSDERDAGLDADSGDNDDSDDWAPSRR